MLAIPSVRAALLSGDPIGDALRRDAVLRCNFENSSNLGFDSSPAGNSLTNNNSVSQVAGQVGQGALMTRASTQYLSLADNAALSMGVGVAFSFALWLNFTSVGVAQELLGKYVGAGNQREYLLDYNDSVANRFSWGVSTDGTVGTVKTVTATTFGAASTGTWYWVFVYCDGTNAGISVNNGASTTVACTNAFDGTAPFQLGCYNGTTNPPAATYDQVLGLKRVMTAAECAYLYNGGSGRVL